MFKKLFDKVDDFVKNFSTINSINDLSKITLEIFEIIKQTLTEIFSGSMEENAVYFDDIMQKDGLFNEICEKAKKSHQKKEELLKFLLYLTILMKEFENRLIERKRAKQREYAFKKILNKYLSLVQEILDNKTLTDHAKTQAITKLKKDIARELNSISIEHTI